MTNSPTPRYRILDLDNCIADDRRRIELIDWSKPPGNERYQAYHADCGRDPFANEHLAFQAGVRNIILTGRPGHVRWDTAQWLQRNGVAFEHLVMRNNSDARCSVDLKRGMVQWLEDCYDINLSHIEHAFDDHPDIVEMYADFGIPATQVQIHNLSAYVNPRDAAESTQ